MFLLCLAPMAIDVCSEISAISPRISFSHDLDRPDNADQIDRRKDSSLLDPTSDFDFCFNGTTFLQELSSADELFSDGKILPIQIKKTPIPTRLNRGSESDSSHPPPERTASSEKKMLKEFLSAGFDADDEDNEKQSPAKPFWQFRRSSSLNCDNSRGKSLIRSLQFLSRSNSTGSAPNPKQSVQSQRPIGLQKQPSVSSRKSSSSSSSSSSTYYPYKPPMKKCGSSGNGVRVSPVLNLPPPYISRATLNLFGFGSIFCNSKFKSKKKKWIF